MINQERHVANRGRRRFCVIMPSRWESGGGGAQYQVKCLLDELLRRDLYEIFYITRDASGANGSEGYSLVNFTGERPLTGYNRLFLDARRLNAAIAAVKPDVIYQRGVTSYVGVGARYARRHGARQIIHVAHDYEVTPGRFQNAPLMVGFKPFVYVERRVGTYGLINSDYIIAQTDRQAQLLERYHGRAADAVIGNFHPLPKSDCRKPDGKIRVVWIANLKPFKRPEIFVRLAKQLAGYKNVEFVMIGHPGNGVQYQSLLAEVRDLPNITFRGSLPIDEVNTVLCESHVFVNTSSAEGFPNTYVQAWMRGVPVVGYGVDVNGLLRDGRTGYLASSYEELESHVRRLLDDSRLRAELGRQAREISVDRFSLGSIGRLVDAIDGWTR